MTEPGLYTRSEKKGGRLYRRAFDHEDAQRRHAAGESIASLAREYGVSFTAVQRVVDPRRREQMRQATLRSLWRRHRAPCRGACGRLVWTNGNNRTGYCIDCLPLPDTEADVRPDELRCKRCRQWKPDAEFPTYKGVKRRRGRNAQCRACNTATRVAWRKRNRARERDTDYASKVRTGRRPLTLFIVFQPDGDGFKEVGRVDAVSHSQAVEKAATAAGEYVAVPASRFQLVKVAPVQTFQVVDEVRAGP